MKHLTQEFDYISTLATVVGSMPGITSLVNELVQNAGDPPKSPDAAPPATHEERWIRFDFSAERLQVDNNNPFSDCGHVDEDECTWRLEDSASPRCDLHSFRTLGSGDKRLQEGAVGAFGYGLLSVYHVTDHPELISRGRHWIVNPLALPNQRITVCPGCRNCSDAGLPPTRFLLPWALDDSPLRRRLKQPPVGHEAVGNFPYQVGDKLEMALLFSRLGRADVLENGTIMKSIQRSATKDSISIKEGGRQRRWHLLMGDFSDSAAELRVRWRSAIEEKRRSVVQIAIPEAKAAAEAGLLFAHLPTGQPSSIPVHINADFYPAPDRKSIQLEVGHKAEWNEAALRCAARILAESLLEVRDVIGPEGLWAIISRARAAAEDPSRPMPLYWDALEATLPDSPVVFLQNGKWDVGRHAFLLQERNPSEGFRSLLIDAGVPIAHTRLRPFWNLLQQHARVPALDQAAVAGYLRTAGLDREHPAQTAPLGLGNADRLEALWEGLATLPPHTGDETLASCAIAPTHRGTLAPPSEVYLARETTVDLFSSLTPTVRFLDGKAESWELIEKLCPTFSLRDALRGLALIERDDLARTLDNQEYEALLGWFDERRSQLDQAAIEELRALPIFPSSAGPRALEDLALPGDFEDPLGIAQLIRSDLAGPHLDLLRALGVRELTFKAFATDHVPRFLEGAGDIEPERLRVVLGLLARRLGEIKDDKDLSARLAKLPIVECQDGQWRRPGEVYLERDRVVRVLGEVAHLAAVPPSSPEAFEDLLKWLGAEDRPRVSDVLGLIQRLQADTSPSMLSRLEHVIVYLSEELQMGHLAEEDIGELASLAWLPAQGELRKLHAPQELFTVFRQYLFATQAKFLAISRKVQESCAKFLEVIGVRTEPDVRRVVQHIVQLARNGDTSLNRQCYEFLNREAIRRDVEAMAPIPSLLLSDGRFIAPRRSFKGEHPFGKWRIQLDQDWLAFGRLLEFLAIKDTPHWRDARDVLEDIASEVHHRTLEEEDLAVTMTCWGMLQAAMEVDDDVPAALRALREKNVVPDPRRLLAKPDVLYFEDRVGLIARFREFLKNSVVARQEGVWRAMECAGVRPLTSAIKPFLVEHERANGPSPLSARLAGRARLLARVTESSIHRATPGQIAERLAQAVALQVVPSTRLLVQYRLQAFKQEISGEPEETATFLDWEQRTLYHTIGGDGPPWAAIAKELAFMIAPEEDPGALASAIKDVLAAETLQHAARLLDDLGFPPLAEDPSRTTHIEALKAGVGGEQEFIGRSFDSAIASRQPEDIASGDSRGDTRSAAEAAHEAAATAEMDRSRRAAGRYRTYVVSEGTKHNHAEGAVASQRDRETESAAIEVVADLERSRGRAPTIMPPMNEGYDLASKNSLGETERYIEVKGTRYDWDGWGVGLTRAEFEKARELGGRYWLYIVERAGQDDPRVHEIQDPAHKVDQYLFDDGWKQVAAASITEDRVTNHLAGLPSEPPAN